MDPFKGLVEYLAVLGLHGITELYGGKLKDESEQLMKADNKTKIFEMMVHHPMFCKFTVNVNIEKLLENKVHDFMCNMYMHIMNHYPSLEQGEVKVELDFGSNIQLCAMYLKRIT